MRRQLIILLLLLLSTVITAQVSFMSSNKEDMRVLGDSLVSNSKSSYLFRSEMSKDQYSYSLNYVNTEDDSDILSIRIRIKWVGKNEDLQIKGTPKYYFAYTEGHFLDLFPFWNKFIKEETLEEFTKKHNSYIFKDDVKLLFKKDGDVWSISMTDIIK